VFHITDFFIYLSKNSANRLLFVLSTGVHRSYVIFFVLFFMYNLVFLSTKYAEVLQRSFTSAS